MAVERTLSIIKPDATRRNLTGKIIAKFEDAGLKVVASRRIRLSQADAEAFYGVHRERPFFKDLVQFMISGPVVVQVLEGEGAIAKNREVMGATNPANAAAGTPRIDIDDIAQQIERWGAVGFNRGVNLVMARGRRPNRGRGQKYQTQAR